MRYAYRITVDCDDLGRRVTVRSRTPDGRTTDTVGVLEACDERAFVIRTRRGDRVTVERHLIVASKAVKQRNGPRPDAGSG